ncbi:hypothetical protein PMI28_02289 [Pseudomonas sp. GM48]|nr:hypothetical protein PMI28_02289 [Pseudomonas sp. GM48]
MHPFGFGNSCRSELARDGLMSNALIQNVRVIVNDHREQARSYKFTYI